MAWPTARIPARPRHCSVRPATGPNRERTHKNQDIMRKLHTQFIFRLLVVSTFFALLPVQSATAAPAGPALAAQQAPDEAVKKFTDLVSARQLTEAQQLLASLIVAYPGDQR